MCLRHGLFQWPCGRIRAMYMASLNVTCPGLFRKPLDATIGRLLTLYCPGGLQGDNQEQNNNAQYTCFAGHFDGHRDAAVQY